MDHRLSRPALPVLLLACLLPAGCGGFSVWPFGEKSQEQSRVPANATEYQCAGNKRFYLRTLDGGASAWIILPDREFRLDKVAATTGTRYSNGSTVLEIAGDEAALTEGAARTFADCRAAPR